MLRSVLGFVVAASLTAALFTGCGSSGACEDAASALCQRAAACSGSGGVRILTEFGDAGIEPSTITLKSESDCEELYQLGCGSPNPKDPVDFGACEAAAEKAACGSSTEGKGVVSPAACNGQN